MLDYDRKKLGRLLSQGRKQKALSQKEVADAMGYSTAQFISNIERGSAVIPLHLLARLIRLYGLNGQQVVAMMMDGHEKALRKKLRG
jgi:transcriptional regulator with XRE-family HTH domain